MQIKRKELWQWQEQVNRLGPRLTGNSAHQSYIRWIKEKLDQMGANYQSDYIPFEYWEARKVSLKIENSEGNWIKIPVASYYPYSGRTSKEGIKAPLILCRNNRKSLKKAKGKIALIRIKERALPLRWLLSPRNTYPKTTKIPKQISSPIITTTLLGPKLEMAQKLGVLGVICIYEGGEIQNQYLPFTNGRKNCPTLWISEEDSQPLIRAFDQGAKAHLTLDAKEDSKAISETVYTILPGDEIKESIIINTHTDGPNACEENGSLALLALIKYFLNHDHRRTLVFAFVTGHFQLSQFALGESQATSRFLRDHPDLWKGGDDNLEAVAGISIEHLGCMVENDSKETSSFLENSDKGSQLEYELVYTGNRLMEHIYEKAVEGRRRLRSITLRPKNNIHFGEGQPLFQSGIPTIALVPGPRYLCRISKDGDLKNISDKLLYEQVITFNRILLLLDLITKEKIGKVQRQSWGI